MSTASHIIQWPFSGTDGLVQLHLVLRGTMVLLLVMEIVQICQVSRTSVQNFIKKSKFKAYKTTKEEMAILQRSGGVHPACSTQIGLLALSHVGAAVRHMKTRPLHVLELLKSIGDWHKARLASPSYMPPLPEKVSATWLCCWAAGLLLCMIWLMWQLTKSS